MSEFRIWCNSSNYSVFQPEKLFFKYDDVIVTSRLVVQVWEVGISQFGKSIPSGTIINSQTFLGKKGKKRFEKQTCL